MNTLIHDTVWWQETNLSVTSGRKLSGHNGAQIQKFETANTDKGYPMKTCPPKHPVDKQSNSLTLNYIHLMGPAPNQN